MVPEGRDHDATAKAGQQELTYQSTSGMWKTQCEWHEDFEASKSVLIETFPSTVSHTI